MIDPAPIRDRFTALSPHLNERERRLFVATEAAAAGYGGIAAVSAATGIAVSTIGRGLKDLAEADGVLAGRVRRVGGGRKPLVVSNPDLLRDLMALVEPGARGDPMSPLRWTCKSLRRLAAELAARGHRVSRTVVGELLKAQKFSLQANSKTNEGRSSGSRRAVSHINLSVTAALAAGAGDFGRHDEKRTGWRLQKHRPGVASVKANPKRFACMIF
jgi:Rhodopirellula transposase DDE domain